MTRTVQCGKGYHELAFHSEHKGRDPQGRTVDVMMAYCVDCGKGFECRECPDIPVAIQEA